MVKILKVAGLFLVIWSLFWVGVVTGITAEGPEYLPIPDQEFHSEGSVGGMPIDIDCTIKSGVIEITVIPASFTVKEAQ